MTFKGPQQVITSGDMSGDITSKVTVIDQLVMLSYLVSWTGASPVGSISVEVSNNYSENGQGEVRNPGTWVMLPLSGLTPVSGNSDAGFIDIDANAGYALRLKYTRASGTGTLNVFAMGK